MPPSDAFSDLEAPLECAMNAVAQRCGMDQPLAYLVEGEGAAATFSFVHGMDPARLSGAVLPWIRRHGHPFYSLTLPQRRQRNKAMVARDVASERAIADSEYNLTAQSAAGVPFPRFDQLRMLICDGPLLLAWFGGFREHRRFTRKDREAFQHLLAPLRSRLAIERRFRNAGVDRAVVDILIERLDEPVVVVTPSMRFDAANAAARAMMGRDPEGFDVRVRASINGEETGFDVHALDIRGVGRRWVLFGRKPAPGEAARRAHLVRSWRLTAREAQVAALIARGLSSKEIAAVLGCAIGTVHVHVSHVLQKSGVDSRGKLAAKIWGS